MNGDPLIILLIEDNLDHAELVKRCFEDHRIINKIFHCSDGESALDYLFKRNKFAEAEKFPTPNVILLDLRLPKVDGLEVLRVLKSTDYLRHIPVVVLTSSQNEKDVSKAYENYANSYLVKPIDFDKFTVLMEELGFYWLGWNKSPY